MYNLFLDCNPPITTCSLPVTPYLRGYATHIAFAYATIIGWLLYYSHQTTTQNNNYTTTIDEEVCQLRQGHIETTCNNNYITTEISEQNEHQNTSNILTADNITSNTVIKSVEELPTVLDTLVNTTISYLKYWLGAGFLMLITAIPLDHSSLVVQVSVDVVFISFMVITFVKMMSSLYSTLLKRASSGIDQALEWLVVSANFINNNLFGGIITNTFVVVLTGFLVVMALDWDSSIASQSSQAFMFAVYIHIIIFIVWKILSLTSTLVGCAARGIVQATTIIVFGLLVFCGWFASGVVTLLRIRIRELGAVSLMVMITAFPWDHSSVVIQQLIEVLIASLMIITIFKMITFVYTLLGVVSSAIVQVLEWVVAPLINIFFDIITNTFVAVLTAFFFIEAKLKLTRVHHQPKSMDNAADDDVIDFGHVENDEQPILRNFRAHPRDLSEAEKKEDVDLVQQAWNLQYDDVNVPPKKKKLQINENKNGFQDIAGREEAEVSIDFLESIRHLIPELQQAAPAKFDKGSPLELLLRKCNAFHLLEDIFCLEEELHALEKQVKKEKRLEKLEKKLQSDLVGWDVPQERSRRIRKQRVIFSPTA